MANLKTVQVPAEVKLQVANQAQVMRNLYKDFQDIFASVDPGSAFGKSIAKAFSKVESKLSASEGLLSREFFSEADLRKVASQLSSISELFGQINIQARGVSAGTLGLDTTEIDNAEKHLRQLQDRVRELKKAKVGTLLGADSKDLQAFAKLSSTTGFSGGKSYAENYKSMEAAIGRVTEKYGQLTIEAQGAEEAVRQANEEVAKARVNLNMAEGQLANRKQANFNVANQIMGVKVSGKGATRDSITEQYLAMLDSQLDQGQWVAGGENFAHIIAGWLEVDEADLAGTATDIVNNLKNAIRTAMAGGPIASNKLRASAKSVLGGEEAALRKDAGYVELEQKVQTSTTYVQGAEIAAEEALSTLQAANNTVEQTRQLLEQIQTQMTRLKQLQDEYNTAVDAQHREQIDAARQGVSTAKANTKAGTINATEEASKTAGRTAQGVQTNLSQMQAMREAADAQAKAEAAAAKESEQFSANLKASVARWMSVQQIINIVKNGIRQAYQDIQSLDKAMTNIAVVTDMSVGDLWGKINEYMSIAQQYGVTTQGVYEVSQLYYQQGLSTSDVMAATTETLKMARIAGMDYAEAADAMTVAIRAFKLEMSDAQHITDVYSKVAAVTASETEELAIAMSKTASSAESVGSSFENTTAMLAVMIETTRESAQNLGSALKSIISRYGEMKQGLTQDSDGEIIDYNKTDAALRSVGISIKDAQGQFRDFDDVIFELSEKWDSLDKNTQRYIATIMAGNRQQSRFIALVDNWERLDEVVNSAQDSEDAGLLQYAKTLDSLESKINNLKTNFQQFYMSIFNGWFFKGAVDVINNFVQSLSRVGPVLGAINLLQLINQIKLVGQLLINTFSKSISKVHNANKEWQNAFTGGWTPVGEKIADALATAILNKASVVGKEFVNRVKTEAENTVGTPVNGNQTPAPEQSNSQPQIQPYSTKILGKASQVLNTWSPLTASALGQYGSVEDRVSILANADPDKVNEAYQKQADMILAAGDKFGDSAKKWAESVKAAGEKFGKDVDGAAKLEGLKELNTADIEAQKELAAVEQEIQKRKAAEVKQQVGSGLMTVGVALSSAGMMADQSTMKGYDLSTGLQATGGALSAIGQFVTGNYAGALVTAVTSVITVFQRVSQRAEAELENAKKASEAANIERAKTKESYTNLQSLLKQYETAKANQYNDDESYQNWLDINNQIVESYPELLGYIDAEGNAIADVTSKTEVLSYYMQKAAEASRDYYNAKITELELQLANNKGSTYTYGYQKHYGQDTNIMSSTFEEAAPYLASIGVTGKKYTDVGGVLVEFATDGYVQQHNYRINIEDLVRSLDTQNVNLTELLNNYNSADPTQRSTEEFGLIRDLIHFGVIKESKQGSGYYVYSDTFKEYHDAYYRQNELIGYKKGAATQNLSLLLSNEFFDDTYDDIDGYESLLYTYASQIKNLSNNTLRNINSSSAEWQNLIEGYSALYSNFSSAQNDIISTLFANLGEYSLSDVESILTQDLNLSVDSDLYKIFVSQWYEKNYGQLANWAQRYGGIIGVDYSAQFAGDTTSAFSNGLDIHNWIKRKAVLNPEEASKYTLDNIDNLYSEYYVELSGALGENDPFFAFIKQNSDATIEAYLDYLANEKKTIDTRGEGYQIAQDRKSWMTNIMAASADSSSELGKILAENEEARNEFWAMIFTDVGTYDWASNVSAWGEKYNYTGFANAEKYAYENYVVRLQTIIDSTSAAVESLDELAKKQSSGFTWEESQKYLKQLQELDPSQSWQNLFEVNEQGLIVLKDFAQTADMLYLSSMKTLSQEAAKSQKIYETLRPQLEYRTRVGKIFDPSMDMDTIFELTNSILHGEGIDGASFTEATYAELEQLIATGEITDTFDLIEWYNNLPEEKRFAGILKQERDWIEEAFKKGGLTDNSEESYNRALELAQTINEAYGLNFDESSQEFQTLVGQIRAGQITSVETLLSFYQNVANQADAANDVFAKQARLLLANTSFTSWSESFTKGNNVKNLASITNGAYTDLQSLWVQRLEQDWQSIMGANQPKYEIGDQILENGEIITLGPQHTDKIGQIKTIDSWDSSDYAAYYDAQAEALTEHGAKLDAFGNLIITDWEKWASYIADSYGYTEEAAKADPVVKEARNQIFVSARAAQMQLEESAAKNIQAGLEELYTTAIEDQELSWDSVSSIIQAANLDSETQNEVLNAYEAAKRQGVTGYIAFINYLTQIIQDNSNGSELDMTALNAAKRDAQNGLISSLVSSLNQGLDGTLTNVDFNAIIEQIGGAPEAYRKYVTETYDGLKLSAEGALVIASQLIDKFGNTSLVAESLVEQLGGSGALGSYEDVDNLINDIINDTDHWAHGNEEILKLLYQMRDEYSQLAEDAQFDFMNQDHFDGAADNWYTFTDNMSTAIDKLKTAFEKGGKIDYKSFDNIVTWISDLSVDGLDTQLGNTGKTLGEFTDAVLATVDATGNLDLSAAAANLGISMDDMAGALEGGLQEVAKQQVAYWKHYLNFLKGIKALQEASDEIIVEPPQVDINNEGKYTYGGQDNLTAEQAYSYWLTDVYKNFEDLTITDFDGNTVQIFSGNNNPLRQLMSFKPELFTIGDDGSVQIKEGMTSYVQQYMNQLSAWVKQEFATGDITKYIDQETGAIKIPWNEVLQIEIDTSGTPTGTANNAEEASEQTQDAAEGAAESALTASGATPNGDGSYTYTLDDMTLKIQMGANGSVEIDLTNATGTLPSAAELRKVFEGQEGFTATDDNNWVFTDPNLGFSVKCSNGTLSFDTSSMTAPAAPTAAELSTILGTAWTTTDGGKTYTTNLNGVAFVYNSATGKININASSFQLTGGLDATSLATILGGTWTTADNGATYTATIAGTTFVYESSSGLVKIDGSKFTLSGGLSATDLANLLGGTWTTSDNGATYTSTINGVTFIYESASGTVNIDSSKFSLAAGLSTEQLTALLGGSWSTTDNGVTYKSTINGVTFIYESTTGAIKVDPSGFTVSAGLTAEQLKTLLGGTWTTEDNGVTYKSTINGSTFVYESTSGKLVVTPPTVASEPTNTDFITLMQSQGWTHANGVYTKNFAGGTLTYNASAGTLAIKPSATMSTTEPDMTALLNSAFGEGGWQPNPNGGYDVLNTTTGEVLYTLPAKITITPTEGSNVGQGDNGLTADVDVTLTPNTSAIDTALAAYNNQPIKISLELTSSKNSLLNSPAYNDIIAKTRAYLDENLSTEDMQTAYYQAYSAFSPYIPSMSREDLEALQQLQSSIDFGLFINEGTEDPWWTALGEEVSAALEALPEEGELTGITALFNSLSGENLAANLLGITSLFSTLVAPELATLDLTGFITQLQSMGELELDDEEINAFVTAITALTTAITALPTEVKVSVKVSAGNSYSVINGIKNALASIKNRTVTVTTKHVSSGSDGGTEEDTVTEDASYAGNVSGLALAKGNATDKLLAGAHLAGKTLVGELGPELAVYDNQYHLLGRDGAEFVNLPNDAIVFNHRQTAGIIKGQAGYRGKALVNGNVTGPAAADGIDAAISAVEKIIKLWSNIADSSLSDLLSGGSSGGGGSGNTIKAVTEELQEWYNLSRQIEHIEQEINNLIAERANLLESDGAAYLRSLREEQALLRDQVATQEVLLEYQQLQLKRQADQINQNDIWSKFLEVDENGLLQYKNGNEANGGKGALDVLQGLNEMSGEEQVEYITKTLGYSYTNADGEKLEGEELVKQFFQEFQDQIDSYDSLYDTVHQTEEKLQQLATSIEEINNEIKENQMDLEQEIFDILVEAWEAEIEALEEQKELIEEANEAYINGLQEALQTERDMYSDNERLADREQLQRQLSLLRRSGGSASEIASLEEQLDSMLKEEYFNKQEQMIQNISDANDEQIRLLDEQIRLEQESLEYQKENGILWSKVYEVMSGSTEDILAFMQGNSQSFFTQSTLQQEQMLTEWAKKVGIYTENRKYEEHESYAKEQVWDTGAIWSQDGMSGLKSTYDALDAQGKETVRNQFASAYASARVNGADHDTALQQAAAAVKQTLEGQQGAQEDEQNQAPTNTPDTSGSETWYVAGPGKLNLRKEASTNSKCLGQYGPGTAMKVLKKDGDWFKVEVDGKTGWVMSQYLTKTKPGTGSGTEQPNNSGSDLTHWTFTFNGTKYSHYKSKASAESKIQSLADGLDAKWAKNVEDGVMTRSEYARRKTGLSTLISNAKKTLASGKHSKGYSKGGLVDYTGLALVHGKPGQPEAFLNAKQTAMIAESVKSVGDGGALDGIRATLAALNSTIRSITNNNTTQTSSFTVAPGAVTIQVAQLNDSYDVEELSKDVMNRMVAIASKSTNRGVNRR